MLFLESVIFLFFRSTAIFLENSAPTFDWHVSCFSGPHLIVAFHHPPLVGNSMNRKSFFGRFAAPIRPQSVAQRPEYFRASFEPLEDRKLLSATQVYVNDTWTDLTHSTGPL